MPLFATGVNRQAKWGILLPGNTHFDIRCSTLVIQYFLLSVLPFNIPSSLFLVRYSPVHFCGKKGSKNTLFSSFLTLKKVIFACPQKRGSGSGFFDPSFTKKLYDNHTWKKTSYRPNKPPITIARYR
jgi:hypothetical protein